MKTYQCLDLAQTQAAGTEIFKQLTVPACVYVHGSMGAGKTSLCQAIIHAAGYTGTVTSPTYNLIHEYPVTGGVIYHLDLYRLNDPAEIEYLGVTDLWREDSLLLIEWPLRGEGFLPKADFTVAIKRVSEIDANARNIVFKTGN